LIDVNIAEKFAIFFCFHLHQVFGKIYHR